VRRVFIMDDCEDLLPEWLRFLRGLVDSDDLPLNVSRELLQRDRGTAQIKKQLVRHALTMLEDLAAEGETTEKDEDGKETKVRRYDEVWRQFGRVLKEGVHADPSNRDRIAKLLRFASTHADTDEQSVSLADYVARMKDGQDRIYYVTADTFLAAKSSPHLEVFRKKGIEVLLASDRVDEWVVGHLHEFDGKPLVSVTRGGLELGKLETDAEREAERKLADAAGVLVGRIKETLGERVKEVRTTARLTSSPACLVADEHDPGANLQRILRAAGQEVPKFPPILEINPGHPLIERLKHEEKQFKEWSALLFDQALLAEGGTLDDPAGFVKRLNELMLDLAGGGSRIWTPS